METIQSAACLTLLRCPRLGSALGAQETMIPGDPADYVVQQHGPWWMVTRQDNQETIYAVPGPVELLRSRALF